MLTAVLSYATASAHAERKELAPPVPIVFNGGDYLTKGYKNKLEKARKLFEKLNDAKLSSYLAELSNTPRQKKALSSLKGLRGGLNRYKKKDGELYKELVSIVEEIERDVKSRRFNDLRQGVSLEVDKANRQYILSWENLAGQEVVKKTPFVQRMNLIMEAAYVPGVRDGEEVMVYQYRVENRRGSEDSFVKLYLESEFPEGYVAGVMTNRYGRPAYNYMISKDRKLKVKAPYGYVNYFRFAQVDLADSMLTTYHPGVKMVDPYVLDEIEGALPGIIESYVPLRNFNPHEFISSERDPSMAADILSTHPDTRTKYMYRGNTIGPVPVPETFSKAGFIEKIISYNEQAIEEGWNDRPPVIKFTREGLTAIKSDSGNKELINEFLSKLDGYYGKKQILSEAYALLKYNLEYMLAKM